jgi:hypothetical protein
MGRWISRDPIEEEGEINLYVMCLNDPVNKVDRLGLWTVEGVLKIICCAPEEWHGFAVIAKNLKVYSFEKQVRIYKDSGNKEHSVQTIAAGIRTPKGIYIRKDRSDQDAAIILVHEGTHELQYMRNYEKWKSRFSRQ